MQQFIINGLLDEVNNELNRRRLSLTPCILLEDIYGVYGVNVTTGDDGATLPVISIDVREIGGGDYSAERLVFCLVGHKLAIKKLVIKLERKTNEGWEKVESQGRFWWNPEIRPSAVVNWVMQRYQERQVEIDEQLQKAYENKEFVPVEWLQNKKLLVPGTICRIEGHEDTILLGHATPEIPPGFRADDWRDEPTNKWDNGTKISVLAHLWPVSGMV